MTHNSYKIPRRALLSGMAASGLTAVLASEAAALPPGSVVAHPAFSRATMVWDAQR